MVMVRVVTALILHAPGVHLGTVLGLCEVFRCHARSLQPHRMPSLRLEGQGVPAMSPTEPVPSRGTGEHGSHRPQARILVAAMMSCRGQLPSGDRRTFGPATSGSSRSRRTLSRIRSSPWGSHEFHSPRRRIVAGTRMIRTTVASSRTAAASAKPSYFMRHLREPREGVGVRLRGFRRHRRGPRGTSGPSHAAGWGGALQPNAEPAETGLRPSGPA